MALEEKERIEKAKAAFEEAQQRIAIEKQEKTGTLDLSNLYFLEDVPEALFELSHLKKLAISNFDKSILDAPELRIHQWHKRWVYLPAIKTLEIGHSDIEDLEFTSNLQALQNLNISYTRVSDLSPLKTLTALKSLDVRYTQVSDLSPLANLHALQSLDAIHTQISDLSPLKTLTALESLQVGHTQVSDLSPLAKLQALQSLNVGYTLVFDLSPLAALNVLKSLFVSYNTQVFDLSPLAALTMLETLFVGSTKVSDLSPLAGLTALKSLYVSSTKVSDLSPLANLPALQSLEVSELHLKDFDLSVLCLPHLKTITAINTAISGIPKGVLSARYGDNCLYRLRAYFEDLKAGAKTIQDTKLHILGNGAVGKTQLSHWLSGETFENAWDSTHGIRLVKQAHEGSVAHQHGLKIWDFGGQDIYHGTHALFMRSAAIKIICWSSDREELPEYTDRDIMFQNHPLAYWVDLAHAQSHAFSPLLIAQTKCDEKENEVRPFVYANKSPNDFKYATELRLSVKEKRGLEAFKEALLDAKTWLQMPERLGQEKIGAGRLTVLRHIENLISTDQTRAPEQRQNRLMTRADFDALCNATGGVSSSDALLHYLDANGVVLYRKGLFDDRIILDQAWALDAIYSVFDRNGAAQFIKGHHGRFTQDDLAKTIWKDYSETERKLFLSFMLSCGICFQHQKFYDGRPTVYIAPDLLNDRAAIEDLIDGAYDNDQYYEQAEFSYDFLHDGIMRSIISEIGSFAGANATYWKEGLIGYEAKTKSRLIIEQIKTSDWKGCIQIRTQKGSAKALLEQITKRVERIHQRLDVKVVLIPDPIKAHDGEQLELPAPAFTTDPDRAPRWYVSYAWKDDKTEEGKKREEHVDRLCDEAKAQRRTILRDKEQIAVGQSISEFMRQLGEGDRVFIFLSDKYLKSANCMYELHELYRNSRSDLERLKKIVRIYTLDDAKIWDGLDRAKYAEYWQGKQLEYDKIVARNTIGVIGLSGAKDYHCISEFANKTVDILAAFADIRQPRTIEDFIQYGFQEE